MSGNPDARHAARIAAVQALYQMELAGGNAEETLEEFAAHRFSDFDVVPDRDFFAAILRGVPQHQMEIDRSIADSLATGWTLARIDSILRAILRCGLFELVARRDVPARTIIDEYVAVTRAFFGGEEHGFVNGVLDGLARRKRATEFGLPTPEGESDF
ncbi:MAG: transcription antitermination factor NusB [Alphaproteobacteria bacterium]|nr:transcription antitermination factor NusB [Alphaproteobacteria bacterium]